MAIGRKNEKKKKKKKSILSTSMCGIIHVRVQIIKGGEETTERYVEGNIILFIPA